MIPAYIAGPFAGDIRENVRRALAVCRWAVAHGYAPECVHTTIAAGGLGDDDNPDDRDRGIGSCVARVRMHAKVGGALLVILRDDGTMSTGTEREVIAWMNAGGGAVDRRTWAQWVCAGVSP